MRRGIGVESSLLLRYPNRLVQRFFPLPPAAGATSSASNEFSFFPFWRLTMSKRSTSSIDERKIFGNGGRTWSRHVTWRRHDNKSVERVARLLLPRMTTRRTARRMKGAFVPCRKHGSPLDARDVRAFKVPLFSNLRCHHIFYYLALVSSVHLANFFTRFEMFRSRWRTNSRGEGGSQGKSIGYRY